MSKTVEGVVVEVKKSNYSFTNSEGDEQSMTDNKITVETQEGRKVTASKHTKASTKLDVEEGTEVKMTYEETAKKTRDGKSYMAKKVTQLVLLNQEKEHKTISKEKTVATATDWAAKDLSMEVSGLLQAIIQHHGVDSKTEERLRTVLAVKRQVADDFKHNNIPQKAKFTAKSVKKEVVEDSIDDDECPFDMDV